MTKKPSSNRRRTRVARSLLVWLVLGAIWWFDRPIAAVQRAEFFSWLVPILVSTGKGLANVAADLIYNGIKGAVQHLAGALQWLMGQVKSFLVSTGAMFAKVWRSLEGFYKNVIRAALVNLHDKFIRFRNWLTKIFKPLIEFLQNVRAHILDIYKRFVRPVLDAIDTARRVLDVLAKLHIPFAKQLETYLAKTEQWIVQQYARLNAELNKVIDTINGILTLDGYLQRFLFLRTIERDVFHVWRALTNVGARSLTGAEAHKLKNIGNVPTLKETTDRVIAHWGGETNDVGTRVDELSATFVETLNASASDASA